MTKNNGIKRRVLRDDVVEHIVDSILNRTLKPGDRIVETRISRDLNVSQGAVREAIRDLSARGLVETEPYKGSRVKVLSERERADYMALRRELEQIAINWGYEMNAINISELHDIVNTMCEGAECRNINVARREDLRFHRRIIEFSQNSSLIRSWEALANEYWTYVMAEREFHGYDAVNDHAREHRMIIEAIESGDAKLMKKRLQDHFS